MPDAQFESSNGGLGLGRLGLSVGAKGRSDGLEALFVEVTALAGQLRWAAASGQGREDCPAAGVGVLRVLESMGPQTVPSIARSRARSRQNIQTLINRLQACGYVALAANPAHKRSGLVQLTDSGRSLVARVAEQEAGAFEPLAAGLPQSGVLAAARLLRRIRGLLAGDKALPDEPAGLKATRKPRPRRSGLVRRKAAAPSVAEAPVLGEASPPDESEFPVNLL